MNLVMNISDNDSGRMPLPGHRTGIPQASARFLWIDEESGDELAVEVKGNEAFFGELETLGFERQSSELDPSSRKPSGRLSASMDVGSGRSKRSKGGERRLG
ncbi:MAG: hypothetical protein ACI8X5_002005 [Planctomycetota bacterium]|jgi:hypothetical protein